MAYQRDAPLSVLTVTVIGLLMLFRTVRHFPASGSEAGPAKNAGDARIRVAFRIYRQTASPSCGSEAPLRASILSQYDRRKSAGRVSARFRISSPKSELAQANQGRVYFFGSSLSKDSCINPVPAFVFRSHFTHMRISRSSVDVRARITIERGQICPIPMWGPPIPSAALPLKK
jgi:hypothetical protein